MATREAAFPAGGAHLVPALLPRVRRVLLFGSVLGATGEKG